MENQEKQDKVNAKAKELLSQLNGFTYLEIQKIGYYLMEESKDTCIMKP